MLLDKKDHITLHHITLHHIISYPVTLYQNYDMLCYVYCKVLVFSSAGITGYRSIYCTAVLNPFVFVTVLVFTFRPTERPTRLKTVRSSRRAGDVCYLFQKISSSRIITRAGFYLNAYDRGIPRVCFEASGSLFAIV